jgi:hypothetical protein
MAAATDFGRALGGAPPERRIVQSDSKIPWLICGGSPGRPRGSLMPRTLRQPRLCRDGLHNHDQEQPRVRPGKSRIKPFCTHAMKIATFNINNINKRLPNLLAWLRSAEPDVVCLQELKATDKEFPQKAIAEAGYRAVWRGQQSWNGVAILARSEPIVTRAALPGDPAGALHRSRCKRRDHHLAVRAQWQSAARTEIHLQARLAGSALRAYGKPISRWRAGGAGRRFQRGSD